MSTEYIKYQIDRLDHEIEQAREMEKHWLGKGCPALAKQVAETRRVFQTQRGEIIELLERIIAENVEAGRYAE